VVNISRGFLSFGTDWEKWWGWNHQGLDWKQRLRRLSERIDIRIRIWARNPGKGSCSVCFLLIVSITMCLMIEIACNLSVAHCFIEVSGFFSRNRLAGQSLPPGGTSEIEFYSCFGLNRLAAMNSCQAVRLRSQSLLMFVAVSASTYVFSVTGVNGSCWTSFWSKLDYQIAGW